MKREHTNQAQEENREMTEQLIDMVLENIDHAAKLYYRLVVLVGLPGTGKTSLMQDIHARTSAPLINVNLNLSKRLLDLTERQRALQLPRILSEILDAPAVEVVLLDNIEILFDLSLKQDPLRLLQGISRNKTVVASWSGLVDREYIAYAEPGHPEYKRYPLQDFLVVNTVVVA